MAKKQIRIVNIVVSTALEKDIPLEKMAATCLIQNITQNNFQV